MSQDQKTKKEIQEGIADDTIVCPDCGASGELNLAVSDDEDDTEVYCHDCGEYFQI